MNETCDSICNKNSQKNAFQRMNELWSFLIFWALMGVVFFIKTESRKQE